MKFREQFVDKGPVKLIHFHSLCQHFKLAYVVLHMTVKEFFETHF